jgi:hypothetical protein
MMALEFMKAAGLCYEIREDEVAGYGQKGLLFPLLRTPCDLISVPFLDIATPQDKIVGIKLRSSRRDLNVSLFTRVIVGGLRQLIDPQFTVFSNCAILRDTVRDNRILLAIRRKPAPPRGRQAAIAPSTVWSYAAASTPTARAEEENEIVAVVQGPQPDTWKESLAVLLETCDFYDPLCPICAQGDAFNVITVVSASIGTRRALPAAAETPCSGDEHTLRCPAGHQLKAVDVEKGIAIDHSLRRSKLWSPIFGETFYRVEPEKWRVEGDARITELTENERDEARRVEYLRARAEFYRFIGADREKSFVLKRVEFIQNDLLETRFAQFYSELVRRVMSRPTTGSLAASPTAKDSPEDAVLGSAAAQELGCKGIRQRRRQSVDGLARVERRVASQDRPDRLP